MAQFIFIFLSSFLFSQLTFALKSLKDQHIQIDWLAPESFAENSETLIGIRFRPDPHWHVYWKNPGDSGAAPKFKIKSIRADVEEILWPYPERLPIAHLTNFGYGGETAYLFKIKTQSQSPVELEVDLEWLVCKEECVPGFGKLTLSKPVWGQQTKFESSIQSALNHFEQKIPINGFNSPYRIEIQDKPDEIKAIITSKTTLPEKIDLFPTESEFIQPAQPQILKNGSSYEIHFQKVAGAVKPLQAGFLLVADNKAYEFSNIKFSSLTESADHTALALLLLSALLGGILLNFMPCVFPIISIKALSLLKNKNSRTKINDGLLYTLGVLTTFAALGGGFLFLRYLGSAVGWGFQLQSPLVVLSLIILFWLMALNFLGVYEFGTTIMNSSGNIRWQSSFGTGVLSVFIAAPCTGPFMGSALGATSTLPGYQAMLVFIFLGLGLALPYLLLTLSKTLAKKIPKPGAWMETLKQFFAFPLFATVLWLLWVLGQQTGSNGWFISGVALLGVSFALWLGKRRKKFWKPLAWIFALLILAYTALQIQIAATRDSQNTQSHWQPYSEEKLNTALQKNQPVFVDFTAAWCITCQVNKKAVLETDAAHKIFEKANVLRLRADWTKQDPVITQALTRLGRNSVPVYAFYSGKADQPELLPQILTLEMIEKLIPLKEE